MYAHQAWHCIAYRLLQLDYLYFRYYKDKIIKLLHKPCMQYIILMFTKHIICHNHLNGNVKVHIDILIK